MLKSDVVERVIKLHEKSYKLLKWVNNALDHGELKFDVIHHAMNTSDAATEWIKRNYENIPLDIRPSEEHIEEFASLFASYLMTSFELVRTKPIRVLKSYGGCHCIICRYLTSVGFLIPRKLSKNARKYAIELKRIYLASLAEDSEFALLDTEIDQLLKDRTLREKIAMTTYCNELIRRTQFASQGEGVLVLWREVAWDRTAPKKGFRLTTEDILNAEKTIIEQMKMIT